MQVHHGLAALASLPPATVISVGNFDGIHMGHREILRVMRELRDGLGGSGQGGVAIITFEPHPLTVLRPAMAPPRLTPPRFKQQLLSDAGVDHLVILPPTPDVLGLEAEAFWRLLRDDVRPLALVEGESFYFGKGRRGTIDALRGWTADSAVTLQIIPPVRVVLGNFWSVPVSSSMIRWLLSEGRARDVTACLGRPYALEGMVVRGNGRGQSIGFPTANLDCGDQMLPAQGVYAGRCAVGGQTLAAAISIGTNPTFNDDRLWTEAHLLDFSADLYGQTLRLDLLDWLRQQQTFSSPEALVEQIHRDVTKTRRIVAGH
jgi:riboflavin kinase/FMN adenylyltransferase